MPYQNFGIVGTDCDNQYSTALHIALQRAIKEARALYFSDNVQVISHSLMPMPSGRFWLTVTVGYN
jgi:hypothetical protein